MTQAEPADETERAQDEARRRFVDDLEARGELVPSGTEPLPPGATHERRESGDDGQSDDEPPEVRRRRFAAY